MRDYLEAKRDRTKTDRTAACEQAQDDLPAVPDVRSAVVGVRCVLPGLLDGGAQVSCLTLCLDCGARRPGIGGANCSRCGSTALELRRGHVFAEQPAGWQCTQCSVYAPKRAGEAFWGVDGWFGQAAELPDCETVSAGFDDAQNRA